MSLATYTDLQTSVASWLKRTDLTAAIPDLITMAEDRLSGDLDARDMDVIYPITVGSEYVSSPADMTELRRMMIYVGTGKAKLRYVTPDQLVEQYPSTTTGQPSVFAVIGGSFQFAPIPDQAYTGELIYRQKLPPLATNSTNWLMTKFPAAYLYATLCEAAPYIVGDARLQVWEMKYAQQIETINGIDWYSGSTMTMKSDTFRG